ncbi:MAG: hypothetical protein V4628_09180 [Pseudomonadota bacterium]
MKIFFLIIPLLTSSVFAQSVASEEYLRQTESKGYDLFIHDFLAANATNIVSVERLQNSDARGWIVVADGDNWKVRFVGDCDESVCSSFDVAFNLEEQSSRLTEFEVPEIIPDEQLAQWKARQLALESDVQRCSETYNTVVLEGLDGAEPVWEVYLLAATRDPNIVVLGGHHRITISADGSRIIKSEPLTKSCLQAARSTDAAALMVTNVIGQAPLETHVFSSLLYRMPLYVLTDAGTYEVEGREIRFVEENPE